MKIFVAAGLAILALGIAVPAQALRGSQEGCVQREASDKMHSDLAMEILTNSPSDKAIAAMMEVAVACAVSTDVPPQHHDAYVIFAVHNSLRESLYDQLWDRKYPVDMLGSALEDTIETSGSPDKVFNTDTGLTDEGFEQVAIYMERRGARLAPDDDDVLNILAVYLAALAKIISVHDVLYNE